MFLTAIALAAAIGAAGCVHTVRTRPLSPTADAEFQALIDGYYRAWSVTGGDGAQAPGRAARFYAQDSELVFFDLAPLRYEGWADYAQGAGAALSELASVRLVPAGDLRITRREDLAWTTVTFRASGQAEPGGPFEFEGRHTAIWERRDGRWLIVHEHVSAPMPE